MDKDIFREREIGLETEYFRKQEQELIAKMRERLAAEGNSTEETTYNCPKCTGKLHGGTFENIHIDVCDNCGGVWLDSGELEQITNKQEGGWFGRLFG